MKSFVNNGFSQYIRVLGFRRESCEILKALTSLAKIPVITNMKNIYKDISRFTSAYEEGIKNNNDNDDNDE